MSDDAAAPEPIWEPDDSMVFVPAALVLKMITWSYRPGLYAPGDKLTWTHEGVIVEKQK